MMRGAAYVVVLLLSVIDVVRGLTQQPAAVLAAPRGGADPSIRCRSSGVCSCDATCGPDGLACVTDPAQRRKHVKAAAKRSWDGYRRFAWGKDELAPVTRNGSTVCLGTQVCYNVGLTIVEGLDTLHVVGLHEEFKQGRDWIVNSFDIASRNISSDTFTLANELLGGLLSSHALTGDEALLQKAKEVADLLMPAYDTPHGLPWRMINPATGEVGGDAIPIGEAAIPAPELLRLYHVTGDERYRDAAEAMWKLLASPLGQASLWDGLIPAWWSVSNGSYLPYADSGIDGRLGDTTWWTTMGGLVDSCYEYIIKMWVLSGKQQIYLDLHRAAMRGVRRHLLQYTDTGRLWFPVLAGTLVPAPSSSARAEAEEGAGVAHRAGGGATRRLAARPPAKGRGAMRQGAAMAAASATSSASSAAAAGPTVVGLERGPSMEHLACFSGGMFALGAMHGVSTAERPDDPSDLEIAAQIASTCYQMYAQSPTGLNPHIVHHLDGPNGELVSTAPFMYNDLMPETLETFFYLWRATHNETYRDWAWQIFRSFEMHSRVGEDGYSGLVNATAWPSPQHDNLQWRWWMAECVKYLYLIFSDDNAFDLHDWVFDTEAHPYPVRPPPSAAQP